MRRDGDGDGDDDGDDDFGVGLVSCLMSRGLTVLPRLTAFRLGTTVPAASRIGTSVRVTRHVAPTPLAPSPEP